MAHARVVTSPRRTARGGAARAIRPPRIMREIAERQANPLNEDYEAWRRSLVARG